MTFFISGHRDLTEEQFEDLYITEINRVLASTTNPSFVVGDCAGVDSMAQDYLKILSDLGRIKPSQVTVYHMFNSPRYLASPSFRLMGGWETDIERDAAMTKASSQDIAFIHEGAWTSGTAQNILRRYEKLSGRSKLTPEKLESLSASYYDSAEDKSIYKRGWKDGYMSK